LHTKPEDIEPWEGRKQSPEIQDSQDIITQWIGDYNQKPLFANGEEKYLKPIMFGEDSESFNLEEITKAAQELSALPNDNKVRMVLHRSGYHSHKHGYAMDGIDVYLVAARVIDKNKYLESVRAKEEKLINLLERSGEQTEERITNLYHNIQFPDCIIVTPYIKVSLPREGTLGLHNEADPWTTRMEMINYANNLGGSILNFRNINTYHESPFGIHLDLNYVKLSEEQGSSLMPEIKRIRKLQDQQVEAVVSSIENAQEVIDRLNAVHNRVYASDIKWLKDLHRKRESPQLPLL